MRVRIYTRRQPFYCRLASFLECCLAEVLRYESCASTVRLFAYGIVCIFVCVGVQWYVVNEEVEKRKLKRKDV